MHGFQTSESDRAEAPHGRRQWKQTDGLDTDVFECRHPHRKSSFLSERRNDQGLLVGPNPSAGGLLDREFQSIQFGGEVVCRCCFQYMDLHQILYGIVEDQPDKVERSDCREALCEISKERGQVAM
jgi:hypothetical protein